MLKDKKINFITSTDENTGSTRIRVYDLVRELKKRGYNVTINDSSKKSEIVVFQKSNYKYLRKRFFKLLFSNKFLIFDIDDLFFDKILNLVKYSDFVITSCEYMREQYLTFNKNIGVLGETPDVIAEDIPLRNPIANLKECKIGCFGTSYNITLIKKFNIKDVKIITRGGDIEWSRETVDYDIQKFDLIVIPQEKTPEGLAKDNCRMLKTLYLGVPALVSDIPEYVKLAELVNYPKEFIVHDGEDWNEKIEKIKSGEIKFDFDFEKCREILYKNYSTKVRTDMWLEIVSRHYTQHNLKRHLKKLFFHLF